MDKFKNMIVIFGIILTLGMSRLVKDEKHGFKVKTYQEEL